MFKTNSLRPLVVNSKIVEWDIESGNTSICREFKLLPEKAITKLENMSKERRVVEIGKLSGSDKQFSKALESGFDTIIEKFIILNELDAVDIQSIKRDAVTIFDRPVRVPKIGEHVMFRPKQTWSKYVYLDPIEVFFDDDSVTVKGISDENIDLHINGILTFIYDALDMFANKINDRNKLIEFLKNFCLQYKLKTLPLEYYREFNAQSKFVIDMGGETILADDFDSMLGEYLDISYNYLRVILPIIRNIV